MLKVALKAMKRENTKNQTSLKKKKKTEKNLRNQKEQMPKKKWIKKKGK